MCAIFGLVNYRHLLSKKQLTTLVNNLAVASEVRGTDASGIAYVRNKKMTIYKKPLPAHKMRFFVPSDITIVTGHTRMTTQGSAKLNYNNHPFMGVTKDGTFALCHNGILYNDKELAKSERLPKTRIQTDSYVAVQLIEKQGILDFNAIAHMSEKVRGSFVFTILDNDNTLYLVKGNNPICLLHFKELGLYIYSSTPDIMDSALSGSFLVAYDFDEIKLMEGDILRIDKDGILEKSCFMPQYDYDYGHYPYGFGYRTSAIPLDDMDNPFDMPYEDLDLLYEMGYCDDDIELLNNDREMLQHCLEEAKLLIYGYV
ncbi:MAG: class II glutamine amidotransferase [Clostridia bacterium]|nr:class II glutamine amidotransferase [Clostridia bacterium]